MATKKFYRVVDGPLSIRSEASLKGDRKSDQLAHGSQITVTEDTVTQDGYVWVHHDTGWSALGTEGLSKVYMLDITDRDPDEPYLFKVWSSRLSVRETPGKNGKRSKIKLKRGQVIEVYPKERKVVDGLIWWRHKDGWSAECSTSRHQIFMKELFEKPASMAVSSSQKVELPGHWKGVMLLQVTEDYVKARSKPTTDTRVQINRYLRRGQAVECNVDEIKEADNYYWAQHQYGWSAIQHVTGKPQFLAEPGTVEGLPRVGKDGRPLKEDLPMLGKLIEKWPVPLSWINSFQYYGNNVFAVWHAHDYYRNTQGLHSGFDFNTSGNDPVIAGVYGTYLKTETPSAGNTKIYIKGAGEAKDYTFVYQHVIPAQGLKKGDKITPDTKIAIIQKDGTPYNPHLHFEIRYIKPWVVNPFWFLSDEMKKELITARNPQKLNGNGYTYKFDTKYMFFYYNPGKWEEWITPDDQPMIQLGGSRMGPTAKYKQRDL